jgi:hypothetical protein
MLYRAQLVLLSKIFCPNELDAYRAQKSPVKLGLLVVKKSWACKEGRREGGPWRFYAWAASVQKKGKKYVLPPTTSSPQVLPRHENQVNCLPQLSKPYNLPSYPSYKRFTKVILSFSIKKSCKYLMRLLNHKKYH